MLKFYLFVGKEST